MAKLYLFCIGGTGSRVLRSLTMMLASGVKINADEIVPVIIDADHANEDLTRTQNLVDNYNFIRKELKFDSNTKNQFWGTKINTDVLGRKLLLPLTQATNKKFKEYIGYSAMTNENKAATNKIRITGSLNFSR